MAISVTSPIEVPHVLIPDRKIQRKEEESDVDYECSRKLRERHPWKNVNLGKTKREYQVAPIFFKQLNVSHS